MISLLPSYMELFIVLDYMNWACQSKCHIFNDEKRLKSSLSPKEQSDERESDSILDLPCISLGRFLATITGRHDGVVCRERESLFYLPYKRAKTHSDHKGNCRDKKGRAQCN
jgi:hypothetical protein